MTLGSLASSFPGHSALGWVALAIFYVGIAFTIGAMMLLAWAIHADSKQ